MDPKLEAVLRAAIDVTSIALVHQKIVIRTPLLRPMQQLMDALSDYPEYWTVLRQMNAEYRAAHPPASGDAGQGAES